MSTANPATVEIHDGAEWQPVCAWADLVPGRGVAVLVGGDQIAVYRDRAGQLYAIDNHDPFSGAYVMSRGILGSRGDVPVVMSPMYKQAFDLRTGTCLDEQIPALRVWPVRASESACDSASPLSMPVAETSQPAAAGVRET
ncbi:nitrite reductase small subunit NirD [Streptomyces apocyni]|uniref:nitrite reductase small subunit NirD n=1 Tax=Streptomyces apocyni TaxID=2654677 RepID=UPI0012EAD524|nr:nitrite reductase small subunit NirD [Streptomyces apocyni]